MRLFVALTTGVAVAVLAGWAVLSGFSSNLLFDRWNDDMIGAVHADVEFEGQPPRAVPQAPVAADGIVEVDPAWVSRTAAATDIPETAVAAYGRASLGAPDGCALGWSTLAGIGWVESQHGTIDDRILLPDGHSDEPVLGPALDGQEFAAIRATARSTALHGNPTWDHAMGPLQFIPSTWWTWGRDGDGDGTADPYDIDDAAASAAAYLCHDGHDLTTAGGWNAAVFSYNHDNAYVVAVHAATDRYGRLQSGD